MGFFGTEIRMRSKLNPDGAKIRTLRIQRGWTQQQLAEIAGVSPRTVQRAETANCAAFETVRAMAGAFDTDFDQLLRSEAHNAFDPEPQIANPVHAPSSEPEIELIPIDLSKAQARRVWAMPFLPVSTLILGLVSGAILTTHFNFGGKAHSSAPRNTPVVSQATETLQKPTLPITSARQEKPAIKVPPQSANAAASTHTVMIVESLPESNPEGQQSEIPITADPGSRDIIQHSPASASIDLPMHSHTLISELVLPEAPVPSNELPVPSGTLTLDEPDTGAVRQAVDLAARKTGAFVSKVSTSFKRVF